MGILDIFKKNKVKPRKTSTQKKKKLVSHKPKTKLCKICKRRIRVRVMNRMEWNDADMPPHLQTPEIKGKTTYSFYNHKNGDRLCRSHHKTFTEEYER